MLATLSRIDRQLKLYAVFLCHPARANIIGYEIEPLHSENENNFEEPDHDWLLIKVLPQAGAAGNIIEDGRIP